jgi:hypothetical protein
MMGAAANLILNGPATAQERCEEASGTRLQLSL